MKFSVRVSGGGGGVHVDVDGGVRRGVAAGELHGGPGAAAPAARDGELRALGVELRLVRGVDRERLEADHVVAVRGRRRNRRRPRRVVRDHLAVAPVAVGDGSGDEAGLVDLELEA